MDDSVNDPHTSNTPAPEAVTAGLRDCVVERLLYRDGEALVYEGAQPGLHRRVLVRVLLDDAAGQVRRAVAELTARGEANLIYDAGVSSAGWGFVVIGCSVPGSQLAVRGWGRRGVLVALILLLAGLGAWLFVRGRRTPEIAAPRVTYPLPMKISLRGVALSAEMQAARERGGRLRCWGTYRERYTLRERPSETEKWDDFVRVQGDSVQFAALRKSRELYGWHAGRTGERHFWKPEVTALSRSPRLYFQADGKLFTYQASVPHAVLEHPGALMTVEQSGYVFSLSADGHAEWLDLTPEKERISRVPGPPSVWEHVALAVGGGSDIQFLDDTGRLHGWSSRDGLVSNMYKELTDIVEMDAGPHHLVTLSADGAVQVRGAVPPATGIPPSMQVPPDLGKCVAVRAGEKCWAAQRPDGTWRAFSVDPEMAVQVAKIGKAIDLDLEVAGPPWDVNTGTPRRYMVWIEPVFDAPPRVPLSEQVFSGSRYEFVPGQPTWTEAKARAEKMGGHLVTLESAAEAQWLVKTFGAAELSEGRAFWIGGEALDVQKGWRWVTGAEAKEVPWLPDHPSVGENEDDGVFPAWMAVQQVGDAVGVNDCSDHAAGIRHWANHVAGFVVEREL